MQGSPQHNYIAGMASRFPELSFAGLRVVGFVWRDQGDRVVEEYVVVGGLTSMLDTVSLSQTSEEGFKKGKRGGGMCSIGTLPPGARSLKLMLAPPGMARPLSKAMSKSGKI